MYRGNEHFVLEPNDIDWPGTGNDFGACMVPLSRDVIGVTLGA